MARRLTPLARAAESDNRLALLKELRSRLVNAIDECVCTRDLEPLTRRLDVISGEIDDIFGLTPSHSPADILKARREERRRKGLPVSIDHSVERGTKLHG
jgi:hypothetical protein